MRFLLSSAKGLKLIARTGQKGLKIGPESLIIDMKTSL